MRKGDIDWFELRIEPLQSQQLRDAKTLARILQEVKDLDVKVGNLERDRESHALTMEQASASVRSLLQRAHRAAQAQGMIPDDDEQLPGEAIDNPPVELQPVRAQVGHNRRRVL